MKQMSDEELSRALQGWVAVDPPAGSEARALAAYRERQRRPSPWLFRRSIRVPVPVALANVGIFVALAIWGFRVPPSPMPRVVVQTRTVEVPVVRERVVTRTVYRPRPQSKPLWGRSPDLRATPGSPGRPGGRPQSRGTAPREVVTKWNIEGFEPVAELRPRIIRSGDEY